MSQIDEEPPIRGEPSLSAGPDESDIHGSPDATLGGYFKTHDRPPAFEGSDAHPYTVSIEVEKTPDLRAPFLGYLVFPRWAENGLGIIGHVETPTLWQGRTSDEIHAQAGDLPLLKVKDLLDQAIQNRESLLPES